MTTEEKIRLTASTDKDLKIISYLCQDAIFSKEEILFDKEKKLLEFQRLKERTNFDLEMIQATGTCSGIENYSRYLSGRQPGAFVRKSDIDFA